MASTTAMMVSSPTGGAEPPSPDSPGGLAITVALALGVVYLLLLVGAYSALCAEALWIVTLNLILGVIVSMSLVSAIASDRARATAFELEFARTVQAHLAAGETLVEASPLGGILKEYARAANEQRRAAREHVYAVGPALYSTALALLATLMVGLANVAGGLPNLIGLAMLIEGGAFVLLVLTAGMLTFSVGRTADAAGFDTMVLRRWSNVTRPSFPFAMSLADVPWAAASIEAPPTDSGSSAPWRETPVGAPPPP